MCPLQIDIRPTRIFSYTFYVSITQISLIHEVYLKPEPCCLSICLPIDNDTHLQSLSEFLPFIFHKLPISPMKQPCCTMTSSLQVLRPQVLEKEHKPRKMGKYEAQKFAQNLPFLDINQIFALL